MREEVTLDAWLKILELTCSLKDLIIDLQGCIGVFVAYLKGAVEGVHQGGTCSWRQVVHVQAEHTVVLEVEREYERKRVVIGQRFLPLGIVDEAIHFSDGLKG